MTLLVDDPDFRLYVGDVRQVLADLPDASADCVVTSPPYLDARPEYDTLTSGQWREVFRDLRRVVTGPMLWNVGRLWRDGEESDWWIQLLQIAKEYWTHLDTLVWVKPNANPIQGKLVANHHEYVLVLGAPDCRLNTDAVRQPYAPGSVERLRRRWLNGNGVKGGARPSDGREPNEIGARPSSVFVAYVGRDKGNPHPAPMATDTAEHLVALGSWPSQTVLDPFAGSGTTGLAARKQGRKSIAIELNPEYAALCARRLQQLSLFAEEVV